MNKRKSILYRNHALVSFSKYNMIDKDVVDRWERWALTQPGFGRSVKPPVLPPTLLLAHLSLGYSFLLTTSLGLPVRHRKSKKKFDVSLAA